MLAPTRYEIELVATTDAAKAAGERDLNKALAGCVMAARAGGYILDIHIVDGVDRRAYDIRDSLLLFKLMIAVMLGVLMWIMW